MSSPTAVEPESRLEQLAAGVGARAALVLRPVDTDLAPGSWWVADDPGLRQARLLIPGMLPGLEPTTLRLPRDVLPAAAELDSMVVEDRRALLEAAGLDDRASSLLLEVAGIKALAVVPLGPRAALGFVILGFGSTPAPEGLRESMRPLATALSDSADEELPLRSLAAATGADLARLYRVDDTGSATVIHLFHQTASALPEVGENIGTAGTAIESVLRSQDTVLVESERRRDWLSLLESAQGVASALFLPLYRDGQVAGVLELASTRSGGISGSASEVAAGEASRLVELLIEGGDPRLPAYEMVRSLIATPAFGQQANVDRICLEVLQPDRENVRFVVGGNAFLPGDSEIAPLVGSATEEVMRGGPAVISTERVNGWFNSALLAQGFHSVLRVPVRRGSELLGVLSLASRRHEAFEDTPQDVSDFAEHLALVVATERHRLTLLKDEKKAQILSDVASALATMPAEAAFSIACLALARQAHFEAGWFLGSEGGLTSGGHQIEVPPTEREGPGLVADLNLVAAAGGALEKSLVALGYRSCATASSRGGLLVAAARRPFAFDASFLALLETTAELVAAAMERETRRRSALDATAWTDDYPQPALLVDSSSGTILAASKAARDLLEIPQREVTLWSLVPLQAERQVRDALLDATPDGGDIDIPLITASGRRVHLEASARPAGRGSWLLLGRDATGERAGQWLAACLAGALASASRAADLESAERAVIQTLADSGIEAGFRADGQEGSPREPMTIRPGSVELPLDHASLRLLASIPEQQRPLLETFRLGLAALFGSLRSLAETQTATDSLTASVAARTAELEGLFAFARDLSEAEDPRSALAVAVAHIAAALKAPVAAEVCLNDRHVAVASDEQAGAELARRIRASAGGRHDLCLPRPYGPPGLGPAPGYENPLEALVASTAGDGLIATYIEAGRVADPATIKLLLTHAAQVGAALDRFVTRREAEESRLRSIADALEEGIALVDADDVVTPENEPAQRLLDWLDSLPGGRRAVVEMAALAREEGGQHERELTDEAGGRRVLLTVAAMPGLDERAALTLRDVTEQRLFQERIAQTEKLAALGQLVSGVAHELNNPLTGILGFAELLQDRPLTPEVRRGVVTIQSEAERAGKIIDNLLSFARRRPAHREAVDVNALLRRVVELRNYDLRANSVEVQLRLGSLAPVSADPDQLQQVFFNVMANAVQAVSSGRTGDRRIEISTRSEDGWAVVLVADNGPGLSTATAARAFEPFFTTKTAGEGTGLGLSISYGIVEEHGGRIEIGNRPEGGAGAVIRLPLGDAQLAGDDDSGELLLPDGSSGPPRTRILVVDDEASIRYVLSQMLQADGHAVVAAGSGAEALTALSKGRFDVVISDLKMPEISGPELYREIVASSPDLARRVIFITGDTVNEETRAFVRSVENPTLEKPFRLENLRSLIKQVLDPV
ncbi:MAG: response regulator [Dehalococcoidia bacterium]|nr:response regulator [Dehalococcoidia bacterium]